MSLLYRPVKRWVPLAFPSKIAAKAEESHGSDEHAGHDHAHGERVKLSPQAQANLNLDVDAIAPESYWRSVLIPGVVVDRPGESDRGVTSRVAGLVTDIRARPGDTVKAGYPLFSVQLVSEFIQSTQTELTKAAKEHQFAIAKAATGPRTSSSSARRPGPSWSKRRIK